MRRALLRGAMAAATLLGGACSDDDATGADPAVTTVAIGGLLDEDCAFLLEGAFMDPGSLIREDGTFDFEANAARYDALADAGPAELREPLRIVAERMHQVGAAFAGVDPDERAGSRDQLGEQYLAAMQVFTEVFDVEYRRAATSVYAYTVANCRDGA